MAKERARPGQQSSCFSREYLKLWRCAPLIGKNLQIGTAPPGPALWPGWSCWEAWGARCCLGGSRLGVRSEQAEIWFLAASLGAPRPAVRRSHRQRVSVMILSFFSSSFCLFGSEATLPQNQPLSVVLLAPATALTLLQAPWECSLSVPLETQHFVTACWWDVPRKIAFQVKTGGR